MSKLNQQEIPLRLSKQIKITKVSDNVFGGNHPMNINEGYSRTGSIEKEPTVGKEFLVLRMGGYFKTSIVTEIIDANTFKTLNSTYKWEVIGDSLEPTI